MSFVVYEPTTVPDAVGLLTQHADDSVPLAGGTDLLLRIRRGIRKYRSVINLKRVSGLSDITWDEQTGLTLGALTTFRAIEQSRRIRNVFPALAEAAEVVAGVQLRNLATIGGNLGNASPSADSVPPLVALGAMVTIAGPSGTKALPVEECLIGPGRTALSQNEIFTTITIPSPAPRNGNAFIRFSPRAAMDIGIVSAAASVSLDADGRCTGCRIALGAVSARPLRVITAEDSLLGASLTSGALSLAGSLAADAAAPISDIRGSADYRRAIVGVLTSRVLARAAARAARGVQ
jgi:CO/xanthine dehydrogenase FAD-binding subunit